MRSNNSKEQGKIYTFKTIQEQVRYLDVLCYNAIV